MHLVLPDEHPPITAWFQIHREEDLIHERPEHLAWLKEEHDFPIFMVRKFDEYPSSDALPEVLCRAQWPFSDKPSFANSFCWMIALALNSKKYDTLYLPALALASPRENWLEAPNMMTWVGIAGGRGVDVRMPGSRLWYPFYYGLKERGIPTWVPEEVANDLITDYGQQPRRWKQAWWEIQQEAWLNGETSEVMRPEAE